VSKEYNYIYDQLVDSEDDIHGIISYSVYKRQKIQFIKDFKEKNKKDPEVSDLQSFNDISTSVSQLEFYKCEATVLTSSFLSDVLDEDLKEREAFFSAKVHSEISNIKPSHLLDIVKSAAGSFLFILLTGVLYFSVWSLSTSPIKVIGQIFDVEITPITKNLPENKGSESTDGAEEVQ
jgi:hypothetical protein